MATDVVATLKILNLLLTVKSDGSVDVEQSNPSQTMHFSAANAKAVAPFFDLAKGIQG